MSHIGWLWAQGALAVVLVVLALPGRRRDVDDDLPEEPVVPAQAASGEGRRARRLRAQAEAEQADQPDQFTPDFPPHSPPPPPEEAPVPAQVPQQQAYDGWDTTTYAGAEYGTYGGEHYQGTPQYPAGTYDQQPYQADPYQAGQYDPYASYGTGNAAYDPTQTYAQGYDAPYDPEQQQQQQQQPPHGTDSERPDGSQQ
jgi:hypothetical protein